MTECVLMDAAREAVAQAAHLTSDTYARSCNNCSSRSLRLICMREYKRALSDQQLITRVALGEQRAARMSMISARSASAPPAAIIAKDTLSVSHSLSLFQRSAFIRQSPRFLQRQHSLITLCNLHPQWRVFAVQTSTCAKTILKAKIKTGFFFSYNLNLYL